MEQENLNILNNNKHYIVFVFIFILNSINLPAQSRDYADRLIEHLDKNKKNLSKDSLTVIYDEIGYHLNNHQSLVYLEKSLKISKELNNTKKQIITLGNLGNIHRLLGNKIQAIQYILDASKLNKQLNELRSSSLNLSQLAAIYYTDNNFEKAIYYYQKAINIYPSKTLDSFNYIMLHLNIGDSFRMQNQLDSATSYLMKSIKLNDEVIKDDVLYGYAYGNLGMAQMSLNQKKEAEKNLKLGVDYLQKIGDDLTAEIFKVELGKLNLQRGKIKEAEDIYLNAYQTFRDLHAKAQIKEISSELTLFYEDRRQFEKALAFEKEMILYKDSLINKEAIQKLEQAKHQFELNKMEFEMELIEQKAVFRSYLSFAAGLIALVLLGIAIYLHFESKRRKRMNILLLEQKEMIAQREEEKALLLKELNHRVKNNLQMISSLLNLQSSQLGDHPAVSAIDSGRFRVEAMSLIHQKLYQKDVHTEIEIDAYIEELVLNLMYSFQSSFSPTFEIEKVNIHIDKAIPLGLIINEFVTNAMKYAYKGIENPELIIELKQIDNQVIVKVKDNGVGLKNSKSTSTSFGLHLVDSLVQQLDGTLTYETDSGTTCILIINKYDRTN